MPVTFDDLNRIPNLLKALGPDFVAWVAWVLGEENVENVDLDAFALIWRQNLSLVFNSREISQRSVNYPNFHHGWDLNIVPSGWLIGPYHNPNSTYSGPRWIFRREINGDVILHPVTPDQTTRSWPTPPVDFDDDTVLTTIMAREFGVDPSYVSVDNNDGTSATVAVMGSRIEYIVFRDDDAVEAEAIARVEEDLQEDAPTDRFVSSFLERFIDEERLKSTVEEMARVFIEEDIRELAQRDPQEFLDRLEHGGFIDSGDKTYPAEPSEWDPPEEYIEQLIDSDLEDRTSKPMQYLVDMMGEEDALKWALANIGINTREAAEAAVREDGPGHFLNPWDGQIRETTIPTTGARLPYVRVN